MNNLNSVELANNLIYRAKNCRAFYVHRSVEDGILFDGPVPFDLTVVDGQAEFAVLALTQDEAELQVDQWLISRT
jgi:hypothetical protein